MSSQDTSNTLTDKQVAFCHEWVKCWNATEAAIAAGYPEKTARQQASQNLSKLNVQEYIKGMMTSAGITRESIVKMLADAFNFDQTKLLDAVEMIESTGENGVTITKFDFDKKAIPKEMRVFLDVEFTPAKGATIKSPKKLALLENIIKVRGLFAPTQIDATITNKVDKKSDMDAMTIEEKVNAKLNVD